ncbi:hypothetical protein BGX38DRAFT_1079857, partial [Terfezia claveryi]
LLQQKLGLQFITATILYNAYTYLNGNQISKYFDRPYQVYPPVLEDYFQIPNEFEAE